jgi:hypothetical protein
MQCSSISIIPNSFASIKVDVNRILIIITYLIMSPCCCSGNVSVLYIYMSVLYIYK